MHFSVLGRIAVHGNDGTDHTPAARMLQRVLALLLLRANREVPTPLTVEELWGLPHSARARKTVQTYMYHLRGTLRKASPETDTERLHTCSDGYRLDVGEEELDLWRFQHLADLGRRALVRGESAQASELLASGLALWRGPAFAGLDAGPVLTAEVARFEDVRVGALETRIDADLRLGRHRELVGELSELAVSHPLEEKFCAQLMLAAYRAGHQQTALDAYLRLRSRLVEELGVEPSARLRRLHADILKAAPGIDLAVSATPAAHPARTESPPIAQLPGSQPDFVGRTSELARISDAFAESSASHAALKVVSLVGRLGVGKTSTAVHVAHRLRDQFPDGQFFAVLHDQEGAPTAPSAVLLSFLGAAGLVPVAAPGSVEALATTFRSWTSERRVLVVLDDAASAEQVRHLMPGGSQCGVLVTSRCRLAGLPATTVRLGPLPLEEGMTLLGTVAERSWGQGDVRGAERVIQLCDGLPLAVRAAGERLAGRSRWTVGSLADRLKDERRRLQELSLGQSNLRRDVERALLRLERSTQRAMLAACSLPPGDLNPDRLAAALGTDTQSAEDWLERLADHHLVDCSESGGAGRLPPAPGAFLVPELFRLSLAAAPRTDVASVLAEGARNTGELGVLESAGKLGV